MNRFNAVLVALAGVSKRHSAPGRQPLRFLRPSLDDELEQTTPSASIEVLEDKPAACRFAKVMF